jgi:UDP-N-acetylmuramoyl-tripeptide--D-alanyl-D-alanine ligase
LGFIFCRKLNPIFVPVLNVHQIESSMDRKLDQLYQVYKEHPAIQTDSRKVEPGSIFFALRGERFDGNKFAEDAVKNGAVLAVVDDPLFEGKYDYLVVEDTLGTLQLLANHHRKQLKTTIISITGSNGKTTTKELTAKVLGTRYRTYATVGNLNNHIGVPLTLLSLTEETEFAVVEMGANHQGEIALLSNIAGPDFGLITNVGRAHLEGFGGFEGVIKGKTELYEFIRRNKGKIFINNDNDILTGIANGIDMITYGAGKDVFCRGRMNQSFPYVELMVESKGKSIVLKTSLTGAYNFENILAAACIGLFFGIDPANIKQAIESYIPQNFRSQIIKTGKNTLIMDAYNANPTSMKAALENFDSSSYENKLLVLGEMLELGEDSRMEHETLVSYVKELGFYEAYYIGKSFSGLVVPDDHYFAATSDFVNYLNLNKIEGRTILIKGSRGNALENLLSYF